MSKKPHKKQTRQTRDNCICHVCKKPIGTIIGPGPAFQMYPVGHPDHGIGFKTTGPSNSPVFVHKNHLGTADLQIL